MRVIAGSARSLKLKTIAGMDTRPTTDRIKETLFNMIAHGLWDTRFLDLFSGSGGIGIEALSRGAKEAVFVERNPAAVDVIRDNLEFTGLKERGRILKMDAFAALKSLEREAPFDYIFMDPPYGHGLEKRALQYLSGSGLVSSDTLIVVEASAGTDFSYLTGMGFYVSRQKNYKTNMHLFIKRAGKEELC